MKRKTNSTRRSAIPPPKTARLAVAIVDSTKIRAKAAKDYEKVKRDLERARQDIDLFHKEDVPAFAAWLHREFGPLLTQHREISRTFKEKQNLMSLVVDRSLYDGIPASVAYQRIMQERELPPKETADGDDPMGNSDADAGDSKASGFGGDDGADFDPFEDLRSTETEAEKRFRERFEKFAESFEGAFGFKPGPMSEELRLPPKKKVRARVKELYRALVRKLHPDSHGETSAEKLETWHQVQAAYEAGDEEQLEVILTLLEVNEKGTAATTSVSLLQRITAQVKRTLSQVKKEAKKYHDDWAWRFKRQKDLTPLAIRIESELRSEINDWTLKLKDLERRIGTWENALKNRQAASARNPKKPSRKKQRVGPSQGEFFF